MSNRFVPLAAIAALVLVHSAQAGDPAISCESGKLKVAGKYVSCVLAAESKAVKASTSADYGKCTSKFSLLWEKSEAKGAGVCPGGEGDENDIQNFLDACSVSVADTLAGGTLPMDVVSCNDLLDTCTGDLATCGGDLSTCDGDLATCLADPPSQPLKTGQTTCYNGTGAVIACAGTGQDGDLQIGVARNFTDNGDGTVSDSVTGLMWEKISDDGSIHDKDTTYTWADAFATKIPTLNSTSFAGYNDWRVPNMNELETLRNAGTFSVATYSAFNTGCAAACTVLTCSCTASAVYWSSTTYAPNPTNAWIVNFFDGFVLNPSKANIYYVRAVRTGA
jgi:hypothetical protein